MDLLADTDAWSRFYRDDMPLDDPSARALADAGHLVARRASFAVILHLLRTRKVQDHRRVLQVRSVVVARSTGHPEADREQFR